MLALVASFLVFLLRFIPSKSQTCLSNHAANRKSLLSTVLEFQCSKSMTTLLGLGPLNALDLRDRRRFCDGGRVV
jgi:hypothetical protein